MAPTTIDVKFIGDGVSNIVNSAGSTVRVERDGLVTLTVAQWNAFSAARKSQFSIVNAPINDSDTEATALASEATTRGTADTAEASRATGIEGGLNTRLTAAEAAITALAARVTALGG